MNEYQQTVFGVKIRETHPLKSPFLLNIKVSKKGYESIVYYDAGIFLVNDSVTFYW